jgi:hypothetical protein
MSTRSIKCRVLFTLDGVSIILETIDAANIFK